MVVGPGNEPAAGRGRMRASRGDREQVVDVLKTAFVQERLTKDELDARIAQALAARTYADLDDLVADLPVAAELSPLVQLAAGPAVSVPVAAHVPGRREVRLAVRTGAGALAVVVATVCTVAGLGGNPFLGLAVAVAALVLAAVTAGFAALVVHGATMIESRVRRRKPPSRPAPPRASLDAGRQQPPAAPRRRPGDPALASALCSLRRKSRSSTTASTSSMPCRSPATRRLGAR